MTPIVNIGGVQYTPCACSACHDVVLICGDFERGLPLAEMDHAIEGCNGQLYPSDTFDIGVKYKRFVSWPFA